MKDERDLGAIKKCDHFEIEESLLFQRLHCQIRLAQYKNLRNKATTKIRNDIKTSNGERIENAKNEAEMWKKCLKKYMKQQ